MKSRVKTWQVRVLSIELIYWIVSFYERGSIDLGMMFVSCLSGCCLLSTLTFIIRDTDFIFDMHTRIMMSF